MLIDYNGVYGRPGEGFMAYGNDNDIAAMRPGTPEQLKAYEQASMANTRPSTGMVGGLGSSRGLNENYPPPPANSNRLVKLAGHLDMLVSTGRSIAERLDDAVNRIHGEDSQLSQPLPEMAMGPGVLGTLEQFAAMIDALQSRCQRALTRLEEVG